jgi:hypothetical protein
MLQDLMRRITDYITRFSIDDQVFFLQTDGETWSG